MSLKTRLYSVLLVSAAPRFNASIAEILSECPCEIPVIAAGVSAAEQAMSRRSFDFVIINSPLPDDAGIRFAAAACPEPWCSCSCRAISTTGCMSAWLSTGCSPCQSLSRALCFSAPWAGWSAPVSGCASLKSACSPLRRKWRKSGLSTARSGF